MARKVLRHPKWAISRPPPNAPTAVPQRIAATSRPFARPRSFSSRFSLKIFELAGKMTASPTPRSSRIASRAAKPRASPVKMVAPDHARNPNASSEAGAEPVHQPAHRNLQQHVRPEKRREQNAQLRGRHAPFLAQQRSRQRQVAAIDIVDQHCDDQQCDHGRCFFRAGHRRAHVSFRRRSGHD